MPGYIIMDKNKATRPDDIIAILAKKGKESRSKIILRKGTYRSRTSSRRLAERLEGGEEKKVLFKKRG